LSTRRKRHHQETSFLLDLTVSREWKEKSPTLLSPHETLLSLAATHRLVQFLVLLSGSIWP
jgi:hypothetical protein